MQKLSTFYFISGEANANYHRDKYNCSFPVMIDDWRMAFHEGSGGQTALDFPFGFVQVPLNSQILKAYILTIFLRGSMFHQHLNMKLYFHFIFS